MKNKTSLVSSIIILTGSSCSNFYPRLVSTYSSDPPLFSAPVSVTAEGGMNSNFYTSKGTINANGSEFKDLLARATVSETDRNELIGKCIFASDQIAHITISRILLNQTGSNLVWGGMTNLFSGLSTVLTPASTKTALSAAAGLSNANRSLINEEVYKNALATAVVKKIEESRATMKQSFTTKMTKTIDEYPIYSALSDLQEYHNTASFAFGMTQVVESSFRTQSISEKVILLKDLKAKVSDVPELEEAVDKQIESLITSPATL